MIYDKVSDLNRRNNRLKENIVTTLSMYASINGLAIGLDLTIRESQIHDALTRVKTVVDDRLLEQQQLLNSDGFFKAFVDGEVVHKFEDAGHPSI